VLFEMIDALFAVATPGLVSRTLLRAGLSPSVAKPLRRLAGRAGWSSKAVRDLDRAVAREWAPDQPTPIKEQKPITIGHGYSTLGVIPPAAKADRKTPGSWFLPRLARAHWERDDAFEKGGRAIEAVCQEFGQRPLALYDNEYGSGTFLEQTAEIACNLLFRVRPNRKLRRSPPSYKGNGRRSIHGALFRLGDPTSWGQPSEGWEFSDLKLGRVRLQRWDELHFEEAPKRIVTLFRIERVEARGTHRDPHVVWLGYCGEELPHNSAQWREYLSRFVVEHWYRFIKQTLNWTLPASQRQNRVSYGARW
jgi:DDE superfamily endonuclease